MKKAKELAEEHFASDKALTNAASNLKRLATGIETTAKQDFGWTDREKKILGEATALLGQLASAHTEAAVLKRADNARIAKRESALRVAMRDNFLALKTIPDRVALVVAVAAYRAKHGFLLDDLSHEFEEAISSLVFRLSRDDPFKAMAPAAAVADAWAKFQGAEAKLQSDHGALIERLTLEYARRSARTEDGAAASR